MQPATPDPKSAQNLAIYSSLGLLLALPLGDTAWALSKQSPAFAWPDASRAQYAIVAALLGLAWCWLNAAAWKLTFSFDAERGLRIGALSLLPCLAGLTWRWVLRVPLPPPHDLPYRSLQILTAAQCLGCFWAALSLGTYELFRSGKLSAWRPQSAALRLGALAFLFFQLNGLWVGQWNMTGDSPHYLLMTHSLAYDGDVDLANNFHHRDWRLFFDYSWDLTPQYPPLPDGRMTTEHKPGLSILLAPAYRLAGDSGAHWTLALLAGLASGLFFLLARHLGFEAGLALLGWALFSFNASWMVQSQNVMPEMLGGLLLLASLSSIAGLIPASEGGAALLFMSFVHIRYTVLALALGTVESLGRHLKGRGRAWAPLLWAGLGLGLGLLATHLLLGDANPVSNRGQRLSDILQPLKFLRQASGLLLDQEFGFLPFTAVFALAPFGLRALWRRDRLWFWQTLLPALGYFALIGSFSWWTGDMAPARLMTCLLPVLALWVLEAWQAWGGRKLFWALALYSWAWGLAMSILPWLAYSKFNGQNWVLRLLGRATHSDWTVYFPSLVMDTPVSYAWVVGLILLGILYWKRLGAPPLSAGTR